LGPSQALTLIFALAQGFPLAFALVCFQNSLPHIAFHGFHCLPHGLGQLPFTRLFQKNDQTKSLNQKNLQKKKLTLPFFWLIFFGKMYDFHLGHVGSAKTAAIIWHHMTSYDGPCHHMMAFAHHMMGFCHHMMAPAII
jgi:hypothetical protein